MYYVWYVIYFSFDFQENLLKSLQASVESEEVAWKKRLSDKEKDLHQLVADKGNLQLQVKQLEDTIEKVKLAEDVSTMTTC